MSNALYDPKCGELARYFLSQDGRELVEAEVHELASLIQDAVEDYIPSGR
jgi:hypothetical protein